MGAKGVGMAGVVFVVAVGVAACGGSGGGTTARPGAGTGGRVVGPFGAEQLKGALLAPAVWGSGWSDTTEGPLVMDSGLGTVGDAFGEDCWTAVYNGSRVGSQTAVEDVIDSGTGDVGHQNVYQFATGDAATMMAGTVRRIDDCGTFKHTDADSMAFTVQGHEEPVPGLGDQAIKRVVQSVSNQSGSDVEVSLTVRYGDVVIDVGYDSGVAGRSQGYDLVGKAKAIAAKLGVTSGAGS